MLCQFTEVVMQCEKVGMRVLGMTCDAGSNNSRLLRKLRGDSALPDSSWLLVEYVRTKNPFKRKNIILLPRYIYLFHCTTHGLKAVRNQLFTSWGEGKNALLNVDEDMIAKKVIEECYERELDRGTRGNAPQTRVNGATVNPDGWSKMNISSAVQPTKTKTFIEILTHLYKELEVDIKDQITAASYKVGGQVNGYFAALADHFKLILTQKPDLAKPELKNTIASFEWLSHVHEIFNATLMNTSTLIDRSNIFR